MSNSFTYLEKIHQLIHKMKNAKSEVADLLRFIQFRTKLTQDEVAKEIGVTRATLNNAASGRHDGTNVVNAIRVRFAGLLNEKAPAGPPEAGKLQLAISRVTLSAVAEILAHNKDMPVTTVMADLERAVAHELAK